MTLTPNCTFAQGGLRRGLRAGTGVLALLLLAAGCAGGGGDASPTAAGASASADVPLVLALRDGFFPVPQADAKDIPWDEVGPGWFLVDAHAPDQTAWTNDQEEQPIPEAVGGLSLVSPDGQWFAARSFAGTGASRSLHWAPDGVWLLTATVEFRDGVQGDVVRVDLTTGASTNVSTGDNENRAYTSAAGGVTVVDGARQDVVGPYTVYGATGVASPDCVQSVRRDQGDLRSFVAPDGLRLVCWGWRSDNKTDVDVVNVQNPTALTRVDTFRLDPYSYVQLGWLSPETFLMARLGDAGQGDSLFAYDLSAQKISDYALPFTPDAGHQLGTYDYASKVFVTSDWIGGALGIYREDGEKIATVDAGCGEGGGPTWALSGADMLVSCLWGEGNVTMLNLETGAIVGTWTDAPGREIHAYGYPAHTS